MLTQLSIGNHGRLGNQIMQLMGIIGFSKKHSIDLILPHWEYLKYFKCENLLFSNRLKDLEYTTINEKHFHYTPELYDSIDKNKNNNFHGYWQSENYWNHCKDFVLKQLSFKKEFIDLLKNKYKNAFKKETIAIHIRKGDYVLNENYHQLPINYYITALFENFKDWQEKNIIIFSDDIPYCQVHFQCLENIFFANGNDIEDLALMSLCDNFILSNSSYSWVGARLAEKKSTKIIRPVYHFEGKLKETCNTKDFWPERWIKHDHKPNGIQKVIDLSDVTFTIPVSYDSKDRKQNLDLNVCYLQHHFNTNIIIGEHGGVTFEYMKQHAVYFTFPLMVYFHRTKMLNDMMRYANTPIVANWDADVIVPPLQLWLSIDKIRKGAEMVYPYKWAFARIPRKPWFKELEKRMDIGIVGNTIFDGMKEGDATSVGGAVIFNKKSFFEGGGENENFVSFGPEDAEREYRFRKLSYSVERTLGPIYHINHWVGPNSSNNHRHVNQNRSEWHKIINMTINELKKYINQWPWSNK